LSWVLDASAVISWLRAEVGGERVRDVLMTGEGVLMHAVNALEVHYHFLRQGEPALEIAKRHMSEAGIQIVHAMDEDLLASAARLKAHYAPIALGDVFAVALAEREDATLLTTDRAELEKIAAAGVCTIEFLR
jgi:PIN domain nuclease of toxin-antitoxin system